jgi:hypothetical protein
MSGRSSHATHRSSKSISLLIAGDRYLDEAVLRSVIGSIVNSLRFQPRVLISGF